MDQILSYLENLPAWFPLVWLLACLSLFLLVEAILPRFKFSYQKIKHVGVNLVFTTTSAIVTNVIMLIIIAPVFLWVEVSQIGLLNLLELPLWLELLFAIVVLDLVTQYGIHYLLHHVKWMWRLHMIHHSDTHIDASTGTRHHPGDIATRLFAVALTVIVFGIPFEFYFLYRMLTLFITYYTHANIRLPGKVDRWLSYLFVTPDMHKFHHHFEAPWTDSNFGQIFSLWDRLFGTLVYEDVASIQYGLDVLDPNTDQNLAYLYALPFNTAVKTNNRPVLFSKERARP